MKFKVYRTKEHLPYCVTHGEWNYVVGVGQSPIEIAENLMQRYYPVTYLEEVGGYRESGEQWWKTL